MPSSGFRDLANKGLIGCGLQKLTEEAHGSSREAGWWHDLETGEALERNRAEMLALIHSEISEALEAERKGLMDDKLTHRPGAEVEMADAVIRICDYCGGHGYDLAGAVLEKMAYNADRPDHKPENRAAEGGKKI